MSKKKDLVICIIIFAILAGVFAFTDLQISQAIVNTDSLFGYLMQAYGMIPGILVGLWASSVLLRLSDFRASAKGFLKAVLVLLLSLVHGIGFWAMLMGQQVDAEINWLLVSILGAITAGIVQLWLKRFSKDKIKSFERMGKITVLLIVLAFLVTVWGVKFPWGRWTYREILEVDDLSKFTPWYLPQGMNGHKSFISGHTAMAFCVLPIVLLFEGDRTKTIIAWSVATSWGILVAFSRVYYGAHFPSDVLFSAGETLLWFWLLRKKVA